MKVILTLIVFVFFSISSKCQESVESISNFIRLKWEVEIGTKNTLPAIIDNYLITADNVDFDGITGAKVKLSTIYNYSDTLLIQSTDYKLNVIDIKNKVSIFERRRSRPYYIGSKEVQLVNDSIFVEVINNTSIQGINLFNHKVLWTTQSNSRIFNKPIVIDNKVFISNLSQLLILDKKSGSEINHISLNGPVLSGLIKYKEFLYMIVKNEGLIALNHNTEQVLWKIELNEYSSRSNRIVVNENRVYYSDNNLHAVNRDDGSLIWETGEKEGVYILDSELSEVKEYLLFYVFKDNENLLTVADKAAGKILYQGYNFNVVNGDRNNPAEVAKEDYLLIDFMDKLINNNILIGVMDNKIYGFKVLK